MSVRYPALSPILHRSGIVYIHHSLVSTRQMNCSLSRKPAILRESGTNWPAISITTHYRKHQEAYFLIRHFAPNKRASPSSDKMASIFPCRFITANSASASPGAYTTFSWTLQSRTTVTHVPPFQATGVKKGFKLFASIIMGSKFPSDLLISFHRRLVGAV